MEEQSGAASMPEELPESLPEGWTVITNIRKNGKVDRYYKSLLTGETLRSKAKAMQYANGHKHPDLQIQPAEQPTLCWDEKHYSESNVSRDMKEARFSLPDGWIVETKYRKGGVSAGASYKIYFNPVTGFKCYSMKDVFRYVTGREPRRRKRRVASSSPDSVLTEFEGSLKRQPFGLENALKKKKYENHNTAARQSQNTVRRSLFRSPRLSFNGIAELSLEDPFFQSYNTGSSECFDASALSPVRSTDVHSMGGGDILDGKVNESLQGQPYPQNKQSQEEADVLLNSTDTFVRKISQIPDTNIAYMTSNGPGVDTRPIVGQHTEKFAVGYPRKNEEAKVSDCHPAKSKESQTGEQKGSKSNGDKEDHSFSSATQSSRDRKGRQKMTIIHLPSRVSRRLAGLGAGPDAYVDINEHALRRKKRLATEKETPPGLNEKPHKQSMSKEDEDHISQRPPSSSTLQASISTPSKANNKDITEQVTITAEDPMTVKEETAAEQSVPFSTVTVEENPIAIEQSLPHSTTVKEDPIVTEHSVLPLSTDLPVENATAASESSFFGEAFLDPCLQFAFKTLTGDFPMFDIPAATGDLSYQQKRPVNDNITGRGESYLSAHHVLDGYALRETNVFSKPLTPLPSDRVLNLNFGNGTITRLTPFKYEFHSDVQSGRGSKRAK